MNFVQCLWNLLTCAHPPISLCRHFTQSNYKSKYYSAIEPFGADVAERFPSATFDIEEASRCYSLGRPTACVMHSMRVLEVGLSMFAPVFDVDTKHKDWGSILGEIEKSVRAIEVSQNKPPNWKDNREFYSQCISDFKIFKNAWRNASMHGRGKYGEEEALDIMNRVRSFMQTMSARFSEDSVTILAL